MTCLGNKYRTAVFKPLKLKFRFRSSACSGKIEFFRVTCLRPHFNLRAARITEPKQLRDLIERFPGGVIERGAKNFVIANAPHVDEQTVPATHDQSNVRLDFFAAKKWREQMPFQMIDREKWFAGADGQTFRRRISDK